MKKIELAEQQLKAKQDAFVNLGASVARLHSIGMELSLDQNAEPNPHLVNELRSIQSNMPKLVAELIAVFGLSADQRAELGVVLMDHSISATPPVSEKKEKAYFDLVSPWFEVERDKLKRLQATNPQWQDGNTS